MSDGRKKWENRVPGGKNSGDKCGAAIQATPGKVIFCWAKPDEGSPSQAKSSQAVHTHNLEKEKAIRLIK